MFPDIEKMFKTGRPQLLTDLRFSILHLKKIGTGKLSGGRSSKRRGEAKRQKASGMTPNVYFRWGWGN